MPQFDTIDFQLIEVELELSDLFYYLDLLEKQIKERQTVYRSELEKIIREQGLTPDDSNWQIVHEYEHLADYRMPRLFRAPFLICLYALYESTVIEIANFIKDKVGTEKTINEYKRAFNLDMAKEYYKQTIHFPLYSDNVSWERIKMLSLIRHAFAHANGRIGALNQKIRDKIVKYEKQNLGISLGDDGYLVLDERFLKETLMLVSVSLNDLISRYKEWDDNKTIS